MSTLWQDLRFAARTFGRAPGFFALAAIVLAIGIGANSAIFSLVDAALLRPFPFADPARLAMLWEKPPGFDHNRVSPLNLADWTEQNQVFSSMAGVVSSGRTLTTAEGGAENIPGQLVTQQFFDLLGVKPFAGRTFSADDARRRAAAVVISERLWRTRFGADPKLLGSDIQLDGRAFNVIGIAPAGFQVLDRADLWVLFNIGRNPENRRVHFLQVIGRLKPGVSFEQAGAGMAVVAQNIARISPETNKDWGVTIEPLRQALIGRELRVTSLVLAGVVGFVLLMACANVANLLLVRGSGRTREIAVRASLGGSRARIARQLLTESVLLAVAGGALGVALAWTILRGAPSFLPPGTLPASMTLTVDTRVLLYAALVTLVTGVLFGMAPAWQAARVSLADTLRSGGRAATSGGGFRTALAVGQIAAAVLLVAGASLMVRTLVALHAVDPGYRAPNVLTMSISLPGSRYPAGRSLTFYQGVEREVASIPGVRSVALGHDLPADGWTIGQGFEILSEPTGSSSNRPSAHYQTVGPAYFDTFGIPFLRGRAFTDRDNPAGPQVCIVNEEFVRRHLKGQEPLGVRMRVDSMVDQKPVEREIVGVIRQVKVMGPGESKDAAEIYVPLAQDPWNSASLSVATAGDPLTFVPAVKTAIARLDKSLAVTQVRSMEQVESEAVAQPRFRAQLVGGFAAIALALAAVGIFGVLAFAVSQRTREFGIRMALGAHTADVLRLVLTGGLKIIAAGVAIGLAGAAFLTRSLSTLLFGVKPHDPATFLIAPLLLSLVAIAACLVPAWRAVRVDPSDALRQE